MGTDNFSYVYVYRLNGEPVYTGQTVDVMRRHREHVTGRATPFDRFMARKGAAAFTLWIEDGTTDVPLGEKINARENSTMDKYGTYNPDGFGRGCNFTRAGYSGTYTEAQYAAWLAARKVGAYLTHRARTTRTGSNLERAVGELLLAGKRPSVAAVARKINRSREHVSRRYGRNRIARAVQAWRAIHSKAHQKHIRDSHANEPDLFIEEKRELAASLKNAWVREIDYQAAQEIILKYEWLGNMGTTRHCFGLFFGDYLAGVTCFGITGGTRSAESVCGREHASKVATLVRGACVHWAHPHSASFLISKSCRLMAEHGKHIFVAYSDPAAGEVGTVYQACSWLYCGTTAGGTRNQSFRWLGGKQPRLLCPCGCGQPMPPSEAYDGRPRDEREVHNYTRAGQVRVEQDMLDIDFPTDNRPGNERYKQHCTRAFLKQRMVDAGFVFEPGRPKHRYVGIYGPSALTKELAAALAWARQPYPKRQPTT